MNADIAERFASASWLRQERSGSRIFLFPPADVMTLTNQIKAILTAAVTCVAFVIVDWTVRFPYTFPDLQNYRLGFESGWYVFSVINLDWLHFMLAEGLWVYGFDALWRWTGNIDVSFYIVSCFATFLIAHYIYISTRSYIATLFIFNPAFVNLVIEQLRSGLAAAIFFTAIRIKRPLIQVPLFVAALSIHTSFLLFVSIYYIYRLAEWSKIKRWLDKRFLLAMAITFALAFVVSYFRDFALSSLGDGRAFVQDDQTSGILLGIGWALFLVTFYLVRSDEEAGFDLYFFALNVFMFAASIFMGTYGSRFVAIGVPALAVMSRYAKPNRRILFYTHYFLFSGLYFWIWAGTGGTA